MSVFPDNIPSKIARYEEVALQLREKIFCGDYPQGNKIPPERELADMFGVNRITISKALSTLVSEGLLERKVGSGTYVNDLAKVSGHESLSVVNVCLPMPPRFSENQNNGHLLDGPGVAEMVYDYFSGQATKIAVSFFRHERELASLMFRFSKEKDSANIIWYLRSDNTIEALKNLKQRGKIFCLLDNTEPKVECNFVGLDNRLGGSMAARELWDNGHRNVIYINRNIDSGSLQERCSGFHEFFSNAGGTCRLLMWDESKEFFSGLKDRIKKTGTTAIAVCNDQHALILQQKLHESGVKVPKDISLIGFDGLSATGYANVPLSTVRQPFERIGFTAASIIDEQWSDPQQPAQCRLIEPTLLKRQSVAKI